MDSANPFVGHGPGVSHDDRVATLFNSSKEIEFLRGQRTLIGVTGVNSEAVEADGTLENLVGKRAAKHGGKGKRNSKSNRSKEKSKGQGNRYAALPKEKGNEKEANMERLGRPS